MASLKEVMSQIGPFTTTEVSYTEGKNEITRFDDINEFEKTEIIIKDDFTK